MPMVLVTLPPPSWWTGNGPYQDYIFEGNPADEGWVLDASGLVWRQGDSAMPWKPFSQMTEAEKVAYQLAADPASEANLVAMHPDAYQAADGSLQHSTDPKYGSGPSQLGLEALRIVEQAKIAPPVSGDPSPRPAAGSAAVDVPDPTTRGITPRLFDAAPSVPDSAVVTAAGAAAVPAGGGANATELPSGAVSDDPRRPLLLGALAAAAFFVFGKR